MKKRRKQGGEALEEDVLVRSPPRLRWAPQLEESIAFTHSPKDYDRSARPWPLSASVGR